LDAATIERVVNMTLNEKPPRGTHWSLRKMAKAVGLSHSSVQRIWAAHELKPHLTRSFNPRIKSGGSNDPKFCEKVQDIVGLYLDPPDKALMLSVDEKSQIQALDRTQPGLPLKKGRAAATRDDDPVCGARCRHREGHRRMHGPPSPSGVPALPAHHCSS
jgi:hypothetical protein